MSCGTKLTGRVNSYSERLDLADKLEDEGEYRLARQVRHDECLDDHDLRRATHALENQGLSKHFDYRERPCECRDDERRDGD